MTDFNNCHLWQTETVAEDELMKLEDVETFLDESHLIRRLKRCNECGQLYFYQFLEEIDWEKGDDPTILP
jgi:formylmethanofuran dehydrogenase subunit E